IYYYTTYSNHQITAVDIHNEDLESNELISYKPIATQQIMRQN
ncbi:MAG: choloylglycine hydrolase, partial [Eubacterium sp.]|nr:choloylglycine hydrolase [Eubacterium sp.]